MWPSSFKATLKSPNFFRLCHQCLLHLVLHPDLLDLVGSLYHKIVVFNPRTGRQNTNSVTRPQPQSIVETFDGYQFPNGTRPVRQAFIPGRVSNKPWVINLFAPYGISAVVFEPADCALSVTRDNPRSMFCNRENFSPGGRLSVFQPDRSASRVERVGLERAAPIIRAPSNQPVRPIDCEGSKARPTVDGTPAQLGPHFAIVAKD